MTANLSRIEDDSPTFRDGLSYSGSLECRARGMPNWKEFQGSGLSPSDGRGVAASMLMIGLTPDELFRIFRGYPFPPISQS